MNQSRTPAFGSRLASFGLCAMASFALWVASVSRLDVVPLDHAVGVLVAVACVGAAGAGLHCIVRLWRGSAGFVAIAALAGAVIGGGLRFPFDDSTQVDWEWDCPPVRGQPAKLGPTFCWNEAHDALELHADSMPPTDAGEWKPAVLARFGRSQQRFAKTLSLAVTVPPYAVFEEDGAVRSGGDGVELVASADTTAGTRIISRTAINSHRDAEQRRWNRWSVAIPAGATAVRLEALPIGNNHYDRLLVRPESVRYRLPLSISWRWLVLADAAALGFCVAVFVAVAASVLGRIALGVAVMAVFAFLPAIGAHFVYQDDLYLLLSAPHNSNFFITSLLAGRPIAGVFWQLIAAFGGDVASLGAARACGLAGMLLVVGLTYGWLRAVGWSRAQALCSAHLILALPPAGLYVAWAVCTPFPLAAAFAAAALLLIFPRMREEDADIQVRPKCLPLRLVAGGLCLLCGIGIYQPAAMYYWSLLVVFVVPAARSGAAATALRRLVRAAVVGAATMAVYFALFKLRGVMGGVELPERTELSGDWRARLEWLTHRVVPATLVLWDAHGRVFTSVGVVALCSLGLLACLVRGVSSAIHRRAETLSRLLLLSAVPVLGFLTICPSFASSDNWISYRILFAPMSLVVLLVANAFRVPDDSRRLARMSIVALAALSTLALLVAARNLNLYFVTPHVQEYAFIRSRVIPALGEPLHEIRIIRPGPQDSCATLMCYDEYGRPSSYTDWGAELIIRMTMREAGFADGEKIKFIDQTDDCEKFSGEVEPGVLKLDLRQLSLLRTGSLTHR